MAAALPPNVDLCAIPAAVPPPGIVSNLVDPPSLKPASITVSAITLGWAFLFTVARLWPNSRKTKYGWADAFCFIAVFLSCGYTATCISLARWSQHQWDIPACMFNAEFMKWLFVQGLFLGPTIFFAKASIFLMYLQIFGAKPIMRYATYVGLTITLLTYGVHIPIAIYFSAPHAGETWNDLIVNGRPSKAVPWGLTQGSLAVFIDIYIFILPIHTIIGLNLPLRKRLQVLAVFLTACMGITAGVLALIYRIKLRTSKDITWDQTSLFICIVVENNVAIIVSCMPAFAAFMKVTVGESAFYKSLQSRFTGTSVSSSSLGDSSKKSTSQQKLHVYAPDSIPQSPQHPYVELGDWKSGGEDLEAGKRGPQIVKSTEIKQYRLSSV